MVTTSSVLTLQLAQALGLYMIVAGLSGLVAPQRWKGTIDDLACSAGMQMAMGVAVFAIGVALVISHSILTDPLAIIVTLFGWAALLEGALLIAAPAPLIRIGRLALGQTRLWAILSLILGLLLGLAGLTGRAGSAEPLALL